MMNNNPFVKAVKEQVKGRLSITGPSGSGKTWTALLMATKLVELEGGRIALLDTEGQSSLRYASDFDFDVIHLTGNYDPQRYIDMIRSAGDHGYTVLIIDSLTHGWNRQGGVLEIADRKKKGNNKWSGWAEARPVQNALSDAIVNTPVHLICTMREKTEWVVETVNNKAKPIKVGTKSIQSDEMVYEFDIAFKMDYQHALFIDKSRCTSLNEQGNEFTDVNHVVETIHAWLTDGEQPTPLWANQDTVKEIFVGYREKGLTDNEIIGFAGVDKWNNYSQWGKYESQGDAIEHIDTVWNAELDIDAGQALSDPAEQYYDSSDDEFVPDPIPFDEEHQAGPNPFFATFTHMRYFVGGDGKQKYLELATAKPGNGVACIIARGYGRSTDFRELVGEEWYTANNLQGYGDAKRSTPYRKLKTEIGLEYEKTQFYNTVTGLVDDNVPF